MPYIFAAVLAVFMLAGCQPAVVHKEDAPPPTVSAEVRMARESGWPVALSGLKGLRDETNGIAVRFTLVNVSDRTLDRLYLTAYLRDSAGDPVLDEHSRSIYKELVFAGPVRSGEIRWGERSQIPAAFHHRRATTVHIRDLRVVFDNGGETPVFRVEGQKLFTGQIVDAGG